MEMWTVATLLAAVAAFSVPATTKQSMESTLFASKPTLYGHPGTRSPLCNWAFHECAMDFVEGDLSQNPHPFGQIPCLTDEDGVLVFESGAILLHLLSKLSDVSCGDRAAITSWIVWSNASLDPICFKETPDGKVYDTGLRQPNQRIQTVDDLLSKQTFLLGDEFSLADVAVASYLLYVLQFFADVNLSRWPHVVRYLKDCANRSAYTRAFGDRVQAVLLERLEKMQDMPSRDKKRFGML